jgi:DNA primase
MKYDDSLIRSILDKADIVSVISSYIEVNKKGRNYLALCPFHDDKHPSLHISKEKQIFKCFVCGHGGNAIQFVQDYEKLNFVAALKKTAEIIGYDDPRLHEKQMISETSVALKPYYKCLDDALNFYRFSLTTEEGAKAIKYFNERGLDEKIREAFALGYSLSDGQATIEFLQKRGHTRSLLEEVGIATLTEKLNDRLAGRIIFPLHDEHGRVVGFSGRIIIPSDKAKYINSPESKIFTKGSLLYNYHRAKMIARRSGYVYVLEGFMDVIAFNRAGIESTVALMGTMLTKQHIALLRMLQVEIILALDGDEPGRMATMKMIEQFQQANLTYRIVDNVNEKRDPDEILNDDGVDGLNKYRNNLVTGIEFTISHFHQSNSLKTAEQRSSLVKKLIPMLASLKDQLILEDYIKKISVITTFSVTNITDLLKKYKINVAKGASAENVFSKFRPEAKPLKRFQMAERQLLYHMLHDTGAVNFYQQKVEYFFDKIYRVIANFIIEMTSKDQHVDINQLISIINENENEQNKELVSLITELALDKNYPKCDENLLNEIYQVIKQERQILYEKELIQKATQGKSEMEKARIISDYLRQKNKTGNILKGEIIHGQKEKKQ